MENFGLRELSAEEIDRAIQAMDRDGYARIAEFFPSEMVAEARAFVNGQLDQHAREYFSYIGREPVRKMVLADIGASANFRNLLARDYAKGTGKRRPRRAFTRCCGCSPAAPVSRRRSSFTTMPMS